MSATPPTGRGAGSGEDDLVMTLFWMVCAIGAGLFVLALLDRVVPELVARAGAASCASAAWLPWCAS